MSQYFDMGDETLWNPSNGAARLFLRHVALYEAELGVPSGIGEMVNDECQVDPGAYEAFVNRLLEWHHDTAHAVIHGLSRGFVATALALAHRAGIEVGSPDTADGLEGRTDVQVPLPDRSHWEERLREQATAIERRMPR
ncbi:hypothetical protein CJI59_08255 [Streptomyces sp. Alain-F2R5]|jgi:hypothetical protein|uniref:DUF6086 family protein n=1 Tax=Streptomyces mutabilis TaxID=67332 RepID=UPI000BDA979C|nr:DUF6086 family protein [Streptomyces sp. Alain-F2R5]PAN01985.1 hypothetical protein CJI59_08255 [Streptomyces sp. Alain-F2R5]